MTNTKRLDVSEIDFESIRNNLTEYLRSQETLQDYDFEGSAIKSVIDLLSYVTHYNAVNANIGLNETFLDTAQFRGSVVGHARQLGYTPRSASAPVATVNISVSGVPADTTLTIPRGHRFRAKINNTSYTFVTTEEYTSTNAAFSSIPISQIRYKATEFVYDSRSNEKYLIPDENVDTSTLLVTVKDSRNSSTTTVFNPVKSLTDVTSTSNIYFLDENPDGLFEISFGDGVIGTALENGNVIQIEYGVTQKTEANGARTFTSVDPISGFSEVSVTTVSAARGGREKESTESVKYTAPLSYASQNRAVVPNDFEAVIRENFANVDSVKVWGGEDNDPPVYGKVFISVLPETGDVLTQDEENQLLTEVIEPKSVITVTPELIDPEFLIITTETFFKYDPSLTNLTKEQLENKAKQAIQQYNQNELGKFDNVFRYSRYLQVIDESDDAILNSFARIYLSKRFVPTLNVPTTYTLNFSVDLYESFGARPVIYESSTFSVNGTADCRFKDFLNTDGTRRVSIVTGSGVDEQVIVRNAGFIDKSRIVLESFAPESIDGELINIEAVPASYDIVGTLNNVVTFDCECTRFDIRGEIDTIVSGRDYSGVNYQTFNRDA